MPMAVFGRLSRIRGIGLNSAAAEFGQCEDQTYHALDMHCRGMRQHALAVVLQQLWVIQQELFLQPGDIVAQGEA
jgi:hypothetical protein